jgi:ABC-type Fe3+/spermidine/putrescine transport system ATPase subunit
VTDPTPHRDDAIRLRDVVCRHGRRADDAFELGPIDLDFAPRSRTALVGPSGSGKSTLLRAMAGLERPVSGTVDFGGRRVHDGRRELVPAARRRVGLLFQSGALWPHMTALRHVRFAAPSLDAAEAGALLARVGLGGKEQRRPGELSGGERQRLALARALAGSPDVLLLDEPLHSVDVHLRDELAALIRDVALDRGLTLVVVTHDRDEALAIADHLAVLHDGRLVQHGPALDLLRAPSTAWTARFLCHAATLPVTPSNNGSVGFDSPFGHHALATSSGTLADSPELVVLPGDARLDPEGPASGRVLRVEPTPDGSFLVHVEVAGRTVRALAPAHDADRLPAPDTTTRLALRGDPRLLPADRPRSTDAS